MIFMEGQKVSQDLALKGPNLDQVLAFKCRFLAKMACFAMEGFASEKLIFQNEAQLYQKSHYSGFRGLPKVGPKALHFAGRNFGAPGRTSLELVK